MRIINYDSIPEADVIVDYIEIRRKKGLYSLILTAGLPGTGKSSLDLRLAELISIRLAGKNIITEDNVVSDVLELINFVRNADKDKVCVCVIEEISVLFPSRRAMAHDNVVVGKILDTARKKQVIILANAPIWTAIDSHIRALGNLYIETLRINKREKVVIAKALRLQTNPGTGKTYFHWLRRKRKEVHRIFLKKPNKKTWDNYEDRKDKFMDELYTELEKKTLKKRGKEVKAPKIRSITKREMEIYDLVVRQGLTQEESAKKLGVTQSNICIILKNLREKMNLEYKDGKRERKVNENNLKVTHNPLKIAPVSQI